MKEKYICKEKDCNNIICHHTVKYGNGRCRNCSKKENRNGRFINGETLEKKYCIDCSKELSKLAVYNNYERCDSCAAKLRLIFRDQHIHKKDCNCNICKNKRGELKGNLSLRYIDGRTPLAILIRNTIEYKNWRIQIFKKDNYTCQECNKTNCYIEAHHKKSFSKILQDFLSYYSQFSILEDKETLVRLSISWRDFWNINNGQTLCLNCHKILKVKK